LSNRRNWFFCATLKGVTGCVGGSRGGFLTGSTYILCHPFRTVIRRRPWEMIALQKGDPAAEHRPSFPYSVQRRMAPCPSLPFPDENDGPCFAHLARLSVVPRCSIVALDSHDVHQCLPSATTPTLSGQETQGSSPPIPAPSASHFEFYRSRSVRAVDLLEIYGKIKGPSSRLLGKGGASGNSNLGYSP
jgi:hypothetical protein